MILWPFHLIFWRIVWMVQDQIGTKQEDFGFLSVYQNRKTMNVGTYHFGNKKYYTKHFDNHNNYNFEVKSFG